MNSMTAEETVAMVTPSSDINISNPSTSVTSESTSDHHKVVKTSNFSMVDKTPENFGTFGEYFNKVFNETKKSLLSAKTLSDIEEAFVHFQKRIGKGKFVVDMLLYSIHEELRYNKNYLSQFNCKSWSELFGKLQGCGINSRQGFYNSVKVGEIIRFLCNVPDNDITYDNLYNNYAKIKYLDILRKKARKYWPPEFSFSELKEHFLHDRCRSFQQYVKELQPKFDKYPPNKRYNRSGSKNEDIVEKASQQIVPKSESELTEVFKKIYQEVLAGNQVRFVPGFTQDFVDACIKQLRAVLARDYDEHNNRWLAILGPNYVENFFSKLEQLEKTTFSVLSCTALFEGAVIQLPSEAIKNVIRSVCKEKTDYELIQAFLIDCLNSNHDFQNLFVEYKVSTAKEFAIKIFDINESQYKRLKKIGRNLSLTELLKGDINLAVPGFLEKIYFLDKALENHDKSLVVKYLNVLTAKQFRRFARDTSFNIADEPINKPAYKKALVLYSQYETLPFDHRDIAIAGLNSKDENKMLNNRMEAASRGEACFKQFYPDIPWPEDSKSLTMTA
jgi:hypothetical protein